MSGYGILTCNLVQLFFCVIKSQEYRCLGLLVWYTSIVSLQVSVPKNAGLPVHFVSTVPHLKLIPRFSEEEARQKIYSVSTRHYFAFGALVSEELSYKLKGICDLIK